MNHKPYFDWMHAALDGAIAPGQRVELEQHLSACAECSLAWEALREVDRLFRAAPPVAPRPGFAGRFQARLAQRQSRPRALWGALALGLGAVGLAALVVPIGAALLVSLVGMVQQPATTAALVSGMNATAAFADSVASALFIAGRAVFEWAVVNPLTWAACLAGLAATVAWAFLIRKLSPEVMVR